MKFRTVLVPLTMPLVLAACLGSGGGGGGGSSSSQSGPLTLDGTPRAFTSFDEITANSLVEADAASSVNYRAATAGGIPDRSGTLTNDGSSVTLLSGELSDPDDATSDPEFGGRRLNVDDPEIEVDFETDATAVSAGVAGVADRFVAFEIDPGSGVTDRLTVDDPANDAFDYMTFGLWEVDIGGDSMDIGGAAWGDVTPTAELPTTTATYTGDLIGYNVVDGSITTYVAESNLTATFSAGTVSFSSTDTRNLETGVANSDFDLLETTGTISGNSFSGTGLTIAALPPDAVTGDPTGDGSFGGNFFGPAAEEAGGWFEMRNVEQPDGAQDRYFGSFGGVAPAP